MIRPLKMTISNIGPVSDITYPLDKSLILFYGLCRAGKTTATHTAMNLLRGGAFPEDILRHGTENGFVQLDIEGGSITRRFWRDPKDGKTKAELVYLRDNNPVPVNRPVEKLRKEFSNPFNEDGDFLKRMGPTDRKQYFVQLLGIDTGELDSEKKDIDDQNRMLEAKIDGYGTIDDTPVLAVDKEPIRAGIASRKREHALKVASWQTELDGLRLEWQSGKRKELRDAKNALEIMDSDVTATDATIARLESELKAARTGLTQLVERREVQKNAVVVLESEVSSLPDLTEKANALKAKIATPCDTADLDKELQEAAAQDVRVAAYQANLVKIEQRQHDNELLTLNKERLKEIKLLKAKMLAQIAEDSGITGLSFDEDGDFLFEGVTNALISTSQHQRLSGELAKMFPEACAVEIIDRGESLGESVFALIDGAKARASTILCTVVGEKPAEVPEEIGVYVVAGGKLEP